VDEGSNWINMFYGPLSLSNPVSYTTAGTVLPPLANYAPPSGSPAVGAVPSTVSHPATDFFGNPRPDTGNCFDVGAVEIPAGADACGGASPVGVAVVGFSGPSPALTTTPATNAGKFGMITVSNTGTGPLTFATAGAFAVTKASGPGTFTLTLSGATAGTCRAGGVVAAGGSCTLRINYAPPPAAALPVPGVAFVTVTDTGAATASQSSANFNGN